MTHKLMVKEIKNFFGVNNAFTSKELFEFYKINEKDLKESTFRWRVYQLKKYGVINNIKRGVYIIDDKKRFNPSVNRTMKLLYNAVIKRYPYTEVCIWSTSWYNDFMNHQVYNSYIIVEVDKDVINSVFNFLKTKRNNVYINPNAQEVTHYLLNEDAIVLKPKIKESPTQLIANIETPKLEKLLVDLYFEKSLLVAYRGEEMKNIFERSFEQYEINYTTLYRYARNRGVRDKIKLYVEKQTDIVLKDG